MNKILFSLLLVCFAQLLHAQASNDRSRAAFIAQKLRDSLSLSNAQHDTLYKITLRFLQRKVVFKHPSTGEIVTKDAYVEVERDEAYRGVMTVAQYTLYLQKKQNLISSN